MFLRGTLPLARGLHVLPGVIDTHMQELIRNCDEERFPEVQRFRELKRDQAFSTPEFVAPACWRELPCLL